MLILFTPLPPLSFPSTWDYPCHPPPFTGHCEILQMVLMLLPLTLPTAAPLFVLKQKLFSRRVLSLSVIKLLQQRKTSLCSYSSFLYLLGSVSNQHHEVFKAPPRGRMPCHSCAVNHSKSIFLSIVSTIVS